MDVCEKRACPLVFMFDLHGVLDRMPEVLRPMLGTLKSCGHKVIICSGPALPAIERELASLGYVPGVHHDLVLSVVDHLKEGGAQFRYDERGNPWTDDLLWDRAKGELAAREGVNIVVDDTPRYEAWMPRGVAVWLWSPPYCMLRPGE